MNSSKATQRTNAAALLFRSIRVIPSSRFGSAAINFGRFVTQLTARDLI